MKAMDNIPNYYFCKNCKCVVDIRKIHLNYSGIGNLLLMGNKDSWYYCNKCFGGYEDSVELEALLHDEVIKINLVFFDKKPDLEWIALLYE